MDGCGRRRNRINNEGLYTFVRDPLPRRRNNRLPFIAVKVTLTQLFFPIVALTSYQHCICVPVTFATNSHDVKCGFVNHVYYPPLALPMLLPLFGPVAASFLALSTYSLQSEKEPRCARAVTGPLYPEPCTVFECKRMNEEAGDYSESHNTI